MALQLVYDTPADLPPHPWEPKARERNFFNITPDTVETFIQWLAQTQRRREEFLHLAAQVRSGEVPPRALRNDRDGTFVDRTLSWVEEVLGRADASIKRALAAFDNSDQWVARAAPEDRGRWVDIGLEICRLTSYAQRDHVGYVYLFAALNDVM
jgi:hypothetical protein